MEIAFLICSLLLLLFGVYIGFLIGSNVGERAVTKADYWKMNAAAIIITVLLAFIFAGLPLLYGAIIGLLAGCIAGLKMAFGESTGPWRALDKMFNVNRSHRETAERGGGEERRRRRKEGAPAPDLISVTEDKRSKTRKNAKDAR